VDGMDGLDLGMAKVNEGEAGGLRPHVFDVLAENLFQQIRRSRGRVGADGGLFLGHVVKDSVQALVHDILGQVGLGIGHEGQGLVLAHHGVISLHGSGLGQGGVDDGLHLLGQAGSHGLAEVLRGGVVGAVQDLGRVLDGHGRDGVDEEGLGLGRGLFRSAVQLQFQVVDQT